MLSLALYGLNFALCRLDLGLKILIMGENNSIEHNPLMGVMLELTRASVFEREPVLPEGVAVDWDRLLDMTQEQGLTAWVWDGICKLPASQQPPRQDRINWGLSAQEVTDGYDHYRQVLSDLIALCQKNGIQLLLLKGFGLAELYPNPRLRSFGDIDVYAFGDFEKLNALLGGSNRTSNSMHSELTLEGVMVENHKFVTPTYTRKYRLANRYIMSSLPEAVPMEGGYSILCAEANLVYLLMHSLTHMNLDSSHFLPMRNVLDMSVFLDCNRSKLEPQHCKALLERLKLLEPFELMVGMCEWVSGLKFADYHFCRIPQADKERARQMLETKGGTAIPYTLPYMAQLRVRWEAYRSNGWRYKYMPTCKLRRIAYHCRVLANILIKAALRIPMDKHLAEGLKQKLGRQK